MITGIKDKPFLFQLWTSSTESMSFMVLCVNFARRHLAPPCLVVPSKHSPYMPLLVITHVCLYPLNPYSKLHIKTVASILLGLHVIKPQTYMNSSYTICTSAAWSACMGCNESTVLVSIWVSFNATYTLVPISNQHRYRYTQYILKNCDTTVLVSVTPHVEHTCILYNLNIKNNKCTTETLWHCGPDWAIFVIIWVLLFWPCLRLWPKWQSKV